MTRLAAILFLALGCCAPSSPGAPPTESDGGARAGWQDAPGSLERIDVGDGIRCYRGQGAYGSPLSCVRVEPMRWAIPPGPKVAR